MNIKKPTLAPLRWCMLLIPLLALFVGLPRAHADQVVCSLSVPQNPLSSTGLSTPWVTSCDQGNTGEAVFVQAAIFSPAHKSLAVYPPLIITSGTTPALAPVVPTLPGDAIVALFGGGNDDTTILTGPGAASCVNGVEHPFGQVFYCNGQNFFAAVNAAHLAIPPLGVGSDGKVCPSVRDFRIVDQDQSDNVQTTYLITAGDQQAQNTAANRATLPGATVAKNPSDNSLLTKSIDPVIGCRPWLLPDLSDNGALVPSQAADELQAARYQQGPVALIPAGDPMAGPNSLAMVNAYRVNVDQPAINNLGQANTVPYCQHLRHAAAPFIKAHMTAFQGVGSPAPGVNLYDFLQARLMASFVLLGCH